MEMLLAMNEEFRRSMEQEADVGRSLTLVLEEQEEYLEAVNDFAEEESVENMAAMLKEAGDFLYVSGGYFEALQATGTERIELLEAVPVELRPRFIMAVRLLMLQSEDFFEGNLAIAVLDRIHASNMSKLGIDGKPVKNEIGKVIKGPDYLPADLTDLAQEALGYLDARRKRADEVIAKLEGADA